MSNNYILSEKLRQQIDDLGDQTEHSGQNVLDTINHLEEELNNPQYKNQVPTFNSMIEQLNKMSRKTIENIDRVRQDINYLEKNKYNLESRYQEDFEDKKEALENLILNENINNEKVEELIENQQDLLNSLEKYSSTIFQKIRKIKETTDEKISNIDLRKIYHGGSRKKIRSPRMSFKKKLIRQKKSGKSKNSKKKKNLSGGMTLSPFEQPEVNLVDIDRDINQSKQQYYQFKKSLEDTDMETKKHQGFLNIYTNQLRDKVHQYLSLIKQRKELKYQVSNLVSNSEQILKEKIQGLDNLANQERKLREELNDKKKDIVLLQTIKTKIDSNIGEIFDQLIDNSSQTPDKIKQNRMVDIYNQLSSSNFQGNKIGPFKQFLDQYIASYLLKNFKNITETDLNSILHRLDNPNEKIIRTKFNLLKMSGGNIRQKLEKQTIKTRKKNNR